MILIPDKLHFFNRKIYSGVVLGFLLAVIIAIVSSYNMIRYVNAMHEELQTLFEKDLMGQNNIQNARINLLYIDRELKAFFLKHDDSGRKESIEKIKKQKQNLAEHIKNAKFLFYSKTGIEKINKTKKALTDYIIYLEKTIDLFGRNKEAAIELSFKEVKLHFDYLDSLLMELNNIKQKKDTMTYKRMILSYETTFFITIGLLILTILLRILLAIKDHKKNKTDIE